MKGNPHGMPYHCERGYGVSGIVACPPFIEAPILHFDYRRELDPTGLIPVWRNLGSLGSASDATGPGGAGNPTMLSAGYPGYSFDGGDYLAIAGIAAGSLGTVYTQYCWLSLSAISGYSSPYTLEAGINGIWCFLRWVGVSGLALYVYDGATNWRVGESAFTLGQPYFAMATRNGNDHAFYLYGGGYTGLRGTKTCAVAATVGQDAIGVRAGTQYWNGKVFSAGFIPGAVYTETMGRYLFERDRHLVGA